MASDLHVGWVHCPTLTAEKEADPHIQEAIWRQDCRTGLLPFSQAQSTCNVTNSSSGLVNIGQVCLGRFVRMEGQIEKTPRGYLHSERRKFVEIMAWIIMISAGAAVLVAFVLLLSTYGSSGRTDDNLP